MTEVRPAWWHHLSPAEQKRLEHYEHAWLEHRQLAREYWQRRRVLQVKARLRLKRKKAFERKNALVVPAGVSDADWLPNDLVE